MRGRKFSSPKDNNSDAIAIKNVIQEIAQEEIKKFGFPTYKAAIVRKINEDGTVDCYLPPNEDNLITKVLNKCGEILFVGDSVEIATKNGSLTNCWVSLKHGTNVQGQAQEVESLSGEVVMKVQNGRLSVTELNRDAVLGNAFTIIAEDINLDGMNIVLNGSRGITISSPYFNVTSQGYITATGGKIGGWEMGVTRLYSGSGSNYVALDSGTSGINYPIWAGNENPANAPFSVTREGTIKATNGTIGSFTLNTNRLYSGSGSSTAGIGVYGTDYAFWAGGDTSSTAPFRVSHGGALTATNANITGTITTSNITATGGKIADYTISGAQLIGNNVGLSGTSGQGWAFWAGSNDSGSAPFRVGHDGSFYASSGSISGSIIANNSISAGKMNVSNLSSISANLGTITGGSININNYFSVNSSGGTQLSTSGGGFLSTRSSTHPYVSALNIAYIAGGGISFRSGTTQDNPGNQMGRLFKGSNDYIYVEKNGTSGYISSTNGDLSSRNLKTNFKKFSNKDYLDAYQLLRDIDLEYYNYKYNMLDIDKERKYYGFIIDDVETKNNANKFFAFKNERGKITKNNELNHDTDVLEEGEKYIDYKSYNPEVLDKYMLACMKAMQNKIDELENKLNQIIV